MKKQSEKLMSKKEMKSYLIFATRLTLSLGQHGHAHIDLANQKELSHK